MNGGAPPQAIEKAYQELIEEAAAGGYHLSPEAAFAKDLIGGMLVNERRYGYRSCPCRLAEGDREKDRDIICPCDYRDADLDEYGVCYCGLYVSGEVAAGEKRLSAIPERRRAGETRQAAEAAPGPLAAPLPVWRCRVCGYLCARENPPETCPICKAGRERFERFL